jgi:SAM-dependent methyltransferase
VRRRQSATRLAQPDASFDAVVGALVLCSVPDPRAALSEIRRVLKPDGALRLFEHLRSPRPWVAALQRVATPFWGVVMDGCHLDRDTTATVRACGFRIEAQEAVAIPSMPLPLLVIRARPHP